ncbi:3620_t:CDS:2 [Funneliformis mosseae]|uniref:3620_t:CDS:1 n=1 Tax=Funneliformis mosseae TaxID=27381 RepID=A0A9N8Z9J7_FUNMO|nr:3620_t:CDS:2 [Funneliformis mosseae]
MKVNSTFLSCDGYRLVRDRNNLARIVNNQALYQPKGGLYVSLTQNQNYYWRRTSERKIERSVSDHYESDVGIISGGDDNLFLAQSGENSTKYKFVLSWSHAIDNVAINNVFENKGGHNISIDFVSFNQNQSKNWKLIRLYQMRKKGYHFVSTYEFKPIILNVLKKRGMKLANSC